MKTTGILFVFVIIWSSTIHSQDWKWAKQITGSNNIEVRSSKMDNKKNLVVLGYYQDKITIEEVELDPIGGRDIFIAKYNQTGDLIWIKSAGSNENEDPFGLALDEENNIFIAGGFRQTANFSDSLIYSVDGQDVFIAKYTPTGDISWVKNVGWGPGGDRAYDIEVGSNNEIFITGIAATYIAFGDSAGGALNDTLWDIDGVRDNFIAKFTNEGKYVWSKQFLCKGETLFRDIMVNSNDLFISGVLFDTLEIESVNYVSVGSGDFLLIKMNITTEMIEWIRKGGGLADDQSNSLIVNDAGDVFSTGYFQGTATFDSTSLTQSESISSIGSSDIFLCKYNTYGNLLWLRSFGDVDQDVGYGLELNKDQLLVTGYFTGEIILNNDTIKTIGAGNNDVFYAVYDTSGIAMEAISIEGTGDDRGQVVGWAGGGCYITGYFSSNELHIGQFILTNSNPGLKDVFIAKYKYPFSTSFTSVKNLTCFKSEDGMLIVTPINGSPPYIYEWDHDPGLTDSVANDLSAGTFKVIVADAFSEIDSSTILITEPEQVHTGSIIGNTNVTESETESYSVDGVLNSTYSWTITGGTISYGQGTDSITASWGGPGTGSVSVFETDVNGCIGDTSSIVVNIGTTSIRDVQEMNVIIFPNPAKNKMIIEFPYDGTGKYKLTIVDLSGKFVKEIMNIRDTRIEVITSDLPTGYYLIEISGPKIFKAKILID